MSKQKLIEFLKQQINECKKLLERAEDRAYKGYLQGQIYAFELALREVENEKNPDCQEPTVYDKILVNGGKLEGTESKETYGFTDYYDDKDNDPKDDGGWYADDYGPTRY